MYAQLDILLHAKHVSSTGSQLHGLCNDLNAKDTCTQTVLKSWLENAYRQVQDLSSNSGFASINVTYEDNVHVLPAAVSTCVSNFQFHACVGFATAGIQCLAHCGTLTISMCCSDTLPLMNGC